eukprot:scaffold569_cov408-Prasinococcus_capsulatus_cf.AAC.56
MLGRRLWCPSRRRIDMRPVAVVGLRLRPYQDNTFSCPEHFATPGHPIQAAGCSCASAVVRMPVTSRQAYGISQRPAKCSFCWAFDGLLH